MFFTNDKNFFLEAKITIFVSLVIWFTITEYFPLHVKGSVGIFEAVSYTHLTLPTNREV